MKALLIVPHPTKKENLMALMKLVLTSIHQRFLDARNTCKLHQHLNAGLGVLVLHG